MSAVADSSTTTTIRNHHVLDSLGEESSPYRRTQQPATPTARFLFCTSLGTVLASLSILLHLAVPDASTLSGEEGRRAPHRHAWARFTPEAAHVLQAMHDVVDRDAGPVNPGKIAVDALGQEQARSGAVDRGSFSLNKRTGLKVSTASSKNPWQPRRTASPASFLLKSRPTACWAAGPMVSVSSTATHGRDREAERAHRPIAGP